MKIIDTIEIDPTQISKMLCPDQIDILERHINQYIKTNILTNRNAKTKFSVVREVWICLYPHFLSFNLCVMNQPEVFEYFIVDEIKFYDSGDDFRLGKHLSFVQKSYGYILN